MHHYEIFQRNLKSLIGKKGVILHRLSFQIKRLQLVTTQLKSKLQPWTRAIVDERPSKVEVSRGGAGLLRGTYTSISTPRPKKKNLIQARQDRDAHQ